MQKFLQSTKEIRVDNSSSIKRVAAESWQITMDSVRTKFELEQDAQCTHTQRERMSRRKKNKS